jgi:hypothetical protein
MKSFSSNSTLRSEYYRDHNFAVDLIEIHLKDINGNDDVLYLASGVLDIDYDSDTAPDAGVNTYSAQGQFMSHSSVSEKFELTLGKLSITVSGLPTGYVDKFINTEPEGKRVVIYKAFLKLQDLSIVETPIMLFDGQIYNVLIQESAETCSIGVECSSIFADFERTAGRRTNNWSNWNFQGSSIDTCMEKAGYVGNTEFLWGRSA